MPTGIFKITDIPQDKVSTVIADYESDIPKPTIEKIDQGGGLWTVVATFPGEGETVKKYSGE